MWTSSCVSCLFVYHYVYYISDDDDVINSKFEVNSLQTIAKCCFKMFLNKNILFNHLPKSPLQVAKSQNIQDISLAREAIRLLSHVKNGPSDYNLKKAVHNVSLLVVNHGNINIKHQIMTSVIQTCDVKLTFFWAKKSHNYKYFIPKTCIKTCFLFRQFSKKRQPD